MLRPLVAKMLEMERVSQVLLWESQVLLWESHTEARMELLAAWEKT